MKKKVFYFFKKIDGFLIKIMNINNIVTPHRVSTTSQSISVMNSTSESRFIEYTSVKELMSDKKNLSDKNRKKVEVAIGLAIAEDIIISFNEITIKYNEQ